MVDWDVTKAVRDALQVLFRRIEKSVSKVRDELRRGFIPKDFVVY